MPSTREAQCQPLPSSAALPVLPFLVTISSQLPEYPDHQELPTIQASSEIGPDQNQPPEEAKERPEIAW